MRGVRQIALCLLLGAVTTVAVAWGSCLFEDDGERDAWLSTGATPWRGCVRLRSHGHDFIRLFQLDGGAEGVWQYVTDIREAPLPGGAAWSQFDFDLQQHEFLRAGWPLRCLEAEKRSSDRNVRTATWHRTWALPIPWMAPPWIPPESLEGTVPLHPVPLPFTINIALCGVAWFVMLLAPGALRRSLRRRRGLCPRCAYDLRGLAAGAKCPECGG